MNILNEDVNSTGQSVLILEKIADKLEINRANGSYVLEGIFAEFDGKQNENGRIYTPDDYLPHLKYLQESIKLGNLVGELDHPEKLEPSLANASHIIEKLEYDPIKKQVLGKIRLLTGPKGQQARSLVDDNVQLSISSRAVGKVREDKTVEIQKIITYDLVAQPGFKNAQLRRINENLGIVNENIAVFSIPEEEAYDFLHPFDKEIQKLNKIEELRMNTNETKDMQKMLSELQAIIESKNTQISELKKSLIENSERVTQVEDYLKEFSTKVLDRYENVKDEDGNSLSDRVTKMEEALGLDEGNSILKRVVEYLDEQVQPNIKNVKSYLNNEVYDSHNELMEEINIIKKYLTEFTEKYNKQLENLEPYLDYVAETVQEGINTIEDYQDVVAESVTNLERNQDEVYENYDNLEKYQDIISSEFKNITEYINHNFSIINHFMNYQDEITENFKNIKTNTNESINIPSEDYISLNENKIIDNQTYIQNKNERIEKLKSNFDNMLEIAKVKKQEKLEESNVNSYLSLLSNENRNRFLLLESNERKNITKDILKYQPITEEQILAIWERNMAPKTEFDEHQELLEHLPNNLRENFEALTENEKAKIFEESKLWNLSSPASKLNFWLNRKCLFEGKTEYILNENLKERSEDSMDSYMNFIKESLNRYNF